LNLRFGITNMSNTALNNHDPELYEEFSIAIAQGDVEKVRECIARGVNIHLSHIDDHTPLGAAAFEGDLEIVKILLDSGADVNARQLSDGFTALMDAVAGGHLEIVRTLVEAGARVNLQSYQGDTAEGIAESNSYEEILEYLQPYIGEPEWD
jgi:uncharacterized protein